MNENELKPRGRTRDGAANRTGPGDRRGAILLLVAVSMIALMGLLVIAIDGGALQRQKRMAQTAADAGALSGAIEIFRKRTDSVVASAKSETARNGFTDLVGGDKVTVTWPNTIGTTFLGPRFVHVLVERAVPTTFASIFGWGPVTVRSRAVAGVVAALNCLVVLDTTGSAALNIEAGAQLNAPTCGLAVNSNNATAAHVDNNPSSQVTASFIGITGGYDGTGYSPKPNTGMPRTADPLADLTMPNPLGPCAHTNMDVTDVQTLSPGIYCGDATHPALTVRTGGSNATLLPGLYILEGGGLSIQSTATISVIAGGSGVTFVLTKSPLDGTYGTVQTLTTATINLWGNTDPNSALPGVLFYQDPAAPFDTNRLQAGAATVTDGTMYFPTQEVDFTASASTVVKGAFIAWRVRVKNNTNLTFTGVSGGQEFFSLRRPAIVE